MFADELKTLKRLGWRYVRCIAFCFLNLFFDFLSISSERPSGILPINPIIYGEE